MLHSSIGLINCVESFGKVSDGFYMSHKTTLVYFLGFLNVESVYGDFFFFFKSFLLHSLYSTFNYSCLCNDPVFD